MQLLLSNFQKFQSSVNFLCLGRCIFTISTSKAIQTRNFYIVVTCKETKDNKGWQKSGNGTKQQRGFRELNICDVFFGHKHKRVSHGYPHLNFLTTRRRILASALSLQTGSELTNINRLRFSSISSINLTWWKFIVEERKNNLNSKLRNAVCLCESVKLMEKSAKE